MHFTGDPPRDSCLASAITWGKPVFQSFHICFFLASLGGFFVVPFGLLVFLCCFLWSFFEESPIRFLAPFSGPFPYSLDPNCFCGPVLGTLSHLFFYCPLAQSVLSWLQSLMFLFSPTCPVILCRHVLFGFDSDELRVVPRVFVYILNVCKYLIWLARNDFRFRDTRPGAPVGIGNVKARA